MKSPHRSAALAAFLAAAPALAAPAAPAPRQPAAVACAASPDGPTVTLASVADDGDVTLADGRLLRLAGLDWPRATATSPDLPAHARAALLTWAEGGAVGLHALSPTLDRWNRLPALLVRTGAAPGDAAPAEAGAVLLAAGLARFAPDPAARACRDARLAAEEDARAARRGLWADPRYAVLRSEDAAGLAAQAGGLALVEGVLHLHQSRGNTYLALGRDRWGFVAIVSRRDAKTFAKAGLDLRDYEGTPVRLRGDLDRRFGPRLRLTDPDVVESLEPGSIVEAPQAPGSARPKHWTPGPEPR